MQKKVNIFDGCSYFRKGPDYILILHLEETYFIYILF